MKEIAIEFARWVWLSGYTRYVDSNNNEYWIQEKVSFEAKTIEELFIEFENSINYDNKL
jgi:hypothetical protein